MPISKPAWWFIPLVTLLAATFGSGVTAAITIGVYQERSSEDHAHIVRLDAEIEKQRQDLTNLTVEINGKLASISGDVKALLRVNWMP